MKDRQAWLQAFWCILTAILGIALILWLFGYISSCQQPPVKQAGIAIEGTVTTVTRYWDVSGVHSRLLLKDGRSIMVEGDWTGALGTKVTVNR